MNYSLGLRKSLMTLVFFGTFISSQAANANPPFFRTGEVVSIGGMQSAGTAMYSLEDSWVRVVIAGVHKVGDEVKNSAGGSVGKIEKVYREYQISVVKLGSNYNHFAYEHLTTAHEVSGSTPVISPYDLGYYTVNTGGEIIELGVREKSANIPFLDATGFQRLLIQGYRIRAPMKMRPENNGAIVQVEISNNSSIGLGILVGHNTLDEYEWAAVPLSIFIEKFKLTF